MLSDPLDQAVGAADLGGLEVSVGQNRAVGGPPVCRSESVAVVLPPKKRRKCAQLKNR